MSSAIECNLYRSIQAILREVDCPIQGVSTCNRGEDMNSKSVHFAPLYGSEIIELQCRSVKPDSCSCVHSCICLVSSPV